MKILLISNVVDLGTRSIVSIYNREIAVSETIEIPEGVRSLGFRKWMGLILKARKASKDADVVICLHHAAIMMGSWFVPKKRGQRIVAIADWTRAYPSMRSGLYIKAYNQFYAWSLRKFDEVFSMSENLKNHYRSSISMKVTTCPLPFPDVSIRDWPTGKSRNSILYVGANVKRKAGDVLLDMWESHPPESSTLSFVSPMKQNRKIDGVTFFTDIKSGTKAHKNLFTSHEIFLLPTRRDSFGLAVLEAMNLGMIPVTTEMAGVSFLVKEAGCPVGRTPEETIGLAFELLKDRAKLSECKKRLHLFMQQYPERVSKSIREIVNQNTQGQ